MSLTKTKSFHTTKTAVSLNTTLVDTSIYYEPSSTGLKHAKELIAGVISSRIADRDHILTAYDVIMKRDDITTLKVETITTLINKLIHINTSNFNTIFTYLLDMFDDHIMTEPKLSTLYFYSQLCRWSYCHIMPTSNTAYMDFAYQKIVSKLVAYKLLTERHYCDLCTQYSSINTFDGMKFISIIIKHKPKAFKCTARVFEAMLSYYPPNQTKTHKVIETIIFRFSPELTPDLINLYKTHNHYNYYYHSQAQVIVPNETPQTIYIDKYPEFYELLYLSRRKITDVKKQKQLFDKYKKGSGTQNLTDDHFRAILIGKTVNIKFVESVFRNFNCDFTFLMFLDYVSSQLSSDRKRATSSFLAHKITDFTLPPPPSSPPPSSPPPSSAASTSASTTASTS